MKYFLTTFLVLFSYGLQAQESNYNKQDEPRNLHVGDSVPEIIISKVLNYKTNTAKISDFKDKLLILDFMQTSCSSCILSLPKMDSLQNIYKDKIQIMVVTPEKETYMKTYLKNPSTYISKKNVKLPWIVEDKVLSSYFKHWYISHEVWIYNGVVKAITYPEYVTANHIDEILNGKKIDWPIKNDVVGFDYDKNALLSLSLNTNSELSTNQKSKFYSALFDYQIGLDSRKYGSITDSAKHIVRTYLINKPILLAYTIAWSEANPDLPIRTSSRTILEVKGDSSRFIYSPAFGMKADWDTKNSFCYESVLPINTTIKERYLKVIEDLNSFLRMNGRWEKRLVDCYVISRAGGTKIKVDSTTTTATKRPISMKALVQRIDVKAMVDEKSWPLIVVDESGFDGKVSIESWNDVASLKTLLEGVGLKLTKTKRALDMFVLTEY